MRPADILSTDDLLVESLGLKRGPDGRTPVELMEVAVDALAQAEEDARILPMVGITRAIARTSSVEDPDTKSSLKTGVKSIATFLLGVGGRALMGMGSFASRAAKQIVFAGGRFLVQRVLLPMLSGVARLLLMTPIGWVITGGTLAYFLYRTFFKRENPNVSGSVLRNQDIADSGEALDWNSIQRSFVDQEPAYGGTVRPGSAVATAASMQAPASAEVTAERLSLGRQILASKRSAKVKSALEEASRRTGVDVGILTAIAYKESTFREVASPGTSGAAGLMQFIPSTWKEVVKRYGDQYGVPKDASRDDPLASAIMGAAYLKHEIYPAVGKVVSNPSATDLYLGHFMGTGGGPKWLRNYHNSPNSIAATDFPTQAKSNPWVYYDKSGAARTYAQIYNMFAYDLNMIQAATNSETQTQAQSNQVSAGASIVSEAPSSANLGADDPNQTPPETAKYTEPAAQYMNKNGTIVRVPEKH